MSPLSSVNWVSESYYSPPAKCMRGNAWLNIKEYLGGGYANPGAWLTIESGFYVINMDDVRSCELRVSNVSVE